MICISTGVFLVPFTLFVMVFNLIGMEVLYFLLSCLYIIDF